MFNYVKFKGSLRLGQVGLNAKSIGQILERTCNIVYFYEIYASFKLGSYQGQILEKPCILSRRPGLIKSSCKYVKMVVSVKSLPRLKLGHIESDIRSNLKNRCVHPRGGQFSAKHPETMSECRSLKNLG